MLYILKNRDLTLLFIASFLFFFNEMLLLPTLPLYLSDLNYSNLELGTVLGAFALGVLMLRPVAGLVTDRKSRKLSLLIGLTIFAIAPPLYLVSESFSYLLCIRFFHGIGITFFTTASPTLISHIAPEHRRGEILGHMSIGSTLSMATGPWFGVEVFTRYGMVHVLIFSTLVGLIGLLLTLFIREPAIHRTSSSTGSYRKIILNRVVVVSSLLALIEALIYGGVFTFLPLLLKNESGMNAGIFFMVSAVVIIVCRLSVSHLSDRYGRGPMSFYPFLVVVAAVVMIAGSYSLNVLLAAAVLYGIGSAICLPTLTALLADNSDPQERGSVYSFFYGAFDLGVLMAGISLGYMADLFGLRAMFLRTALLGLFAALFFMMAIQPGCGRSVRWTLTGKK